MKKRFIALALAIILCALTACSSGRSGRSGGSGSPGGSGSSAKKDSVTLSEYLSSKQTIWYRIYSDTGLWEKYRLKTPGKDATVGPVYIFYPDGTYRAAGFKNLTLGELARMSDEEIIAMVMEKDDTLHDYSLAIHTDSTGNATEEEEIVGTSYLNKLRPITKPYYNSQSSFQIYESTYYGYSGDEYYYEYFLTRSDKEIIFELDEVGTEGIEIDP